MDRRIRTGARGTAVPVAVLAARVVAGIVAATTLAACTGGSSSGDASTPPASGAARSSGASSSTTPASAGPTVASPTATPDNIDQPAPTAPVIRDGRTPTPTVSAAPVPFDGGRQARYPDGISLQIASIRQGATTADGSKTIAGPKTTFSLRFRNGSARRVVLNQVVVSASYGPRALAARPVYDDRDASLRDFSGTLAPGAATTAVYAFSIPTSELSDVTLRIDFDAIHVAARFTGRARAR